MAHYHHDWRAALPECLCWWSCDTLWRRTQLISERRRTTLLLLLLPLWLEAWTGSCWELGRKLSEPSASPEWLLCRNYCCHFLILLSVRKSERQLLCRCFFSKWSFSDVSMLTASGQTWNKKIKAAVGSCVLLCYNIYLLLCHFRPVRDKKKHRNNYLNNLNKVTAPLKMGPEHLMWTQSAAAIWINENSFLTSEPPLPSYWWSNIQKLDMATAHDVLTFTFQALSTWICNICCICYCLLLYVMWQGTGGLGRLRTPDSQDTGLVHVPLDRWPGCMIIVSIERTVNCHSRMRLDAEGIADRLCGTSND